MDEQKKKPLCSTCKAELLPESIFCTGCKSWQKTATCAVCGQTLPPGAKRCNACSTYQKGWWHKLLPSSQIILALLVALVTVATPLIKAIFWAVDRNSKTSAVVTKFDPEAISLYTWNTGRKPSSVVRCALQFGRLPYEDMELALFDNTERFIIPPGIPDSASLNGVSLKFRFQRLTKRCTGEQKNTAEAVLQVEVQESNDHKTILRLPLSEADIGVLNEKELLKQVNPCN